MVDLSKVSGIIQQNVADIAKLEGNTKQIDSKKEVNELSNLLSGAKSREDVSYIKAIMEEGTKVAEAENVKLQNAEKKENVKNANRKQEEKQEAYNLDLTHTSEEDRAKKLQSQLEKIEIKCKREHLDESSKQRLINQAKACVIGQTVFDKKTNKLYEITDVLSVEPEIIFRKKCLTKYVESANDKADGEKTNFDNYKAAQKAFSEAKTEDEKKAFVGNTFRRKSGATAMIKGYSSDEKGKQRLLYKVNIDINYDFIPNNNPYTANYYKAVREGKNKEEQMAELNKAVGKTYLCNQDGHIYIITGWNFSGHPCAILTPEEEYVAVEQ